MTQLNQLPIRPPLLQAVLWRYKFSQLKGSSDDGKTRVKLLFKNAESQQIEMKVSALRHYPTDVSSEEFGPPHIVVAG